VLTLYVKLPERNVDLKHAVVARGVVVEWEL